MYNNILLATQWAALPFVLGVWLWRRRFFIKHARLILVVVIVFVTLTTVAQSALVFFGWSADPTYGQFLLPTYQDDYFYFYVLMRFFAPYLTSLTLALTLFYLLPFVNKRYGGKFFEPEEPHMAAISVFLVSHPGWLIYLITLLLIYLGWHLWSHLRGRRNMRLPLYNLWFITGVLILIVDNCWLVNTPVWKLLEI